MVTPRPRKKIQRRGEFEGFEMPRFPGSPKPIGYISGLQMALKQAAKGNRAVKRQVVKSASARGRPTRSRIKKG
ncbi:MAG: hypothetical protein Q7S21_05680 [archaeon]|nr:hypothetical protein [archaeon]